MTRGSRQLPRSSFLLPGARLASCRGAAGRELPGNGVRVGGGWQTRRVSASTVNLPEADFTGFWSAHFRAGPCAPAGVPVGAAERWRTTRGQAQTCPPSWTSAVGPRRRRATDLLVRYDVSSIRWAVFPQRSSFTDTSRRQVRRADTGVSWTLEPNL